ncbi:glycosyltransferase family 4 protein [Aliidiomarina indica]|uniref:glycosyltransferase family 4 protein n=1 Tax=Aliidiomarina indica TaxID=2749147 RepID=UPI001E4C82FF|nr:glycosyltransferase family 4 protein [Aliidiomarina indica]
MIKVLFLTYYFEPDLSAGSFRASALVKSLIEKLPTGSEIDVVTTQPNRYHSFESKSESCEQRDNLTIHRVQLPAHKNGFVDQALTFRHYAQFARRIAKGKSYDIVVGTSSRLMTAVLASYMARKLNTKLYLDIRDIFVDTISDVFPRYITSWAVPVFGLLEKYAVRRANHVNLVSEGFRQYFEPKYPNTNFSYFTNGIDDVFVNHSWATVTRTDFPKTIVYAGNMGDGQGLHFIIPELAQRLGPDFRFRLIGDGGKKGVLLQKVRALKLTNVEVLPPVKRDALLSEYVKADILFLHLNDVPAFEKVLPSKVFEYAATGKPILAGVSGYASEFISNYIENAMVFKPCDYQMGTEAIKRLEYQYTDRGEFISSYARSKICDELAHNICRMLEK